MSKKIEIDIDAILNLREKGLSERKIAKELNLSRTVVRNGLYPVLETEHKDRRFFSVNDYFFNELNNE